jgi:D-sedoheptulose 7-phosphate isomerase
MLTLKTANQYDSLKLIYQNGFEEHAQIQILTSTQCLDDLIELTKLCLNSLNNGGKIMFAGNGGSAADAQHLATELTVRFEENRSPIAAIALTTDTSTLTAGANDFGFSRVFARQIEAIGKLGDVFIGITTSGNSKNVLASFEQAKKMGIVCVAMTGAGGVQLREQVDLLLSVPSLSTARIQEQHILLGHLLCKGLEQIFSRNN